MQILFYFLCPKDKNQENDDYEHVNISYDPHIQKKTKENYYNTNMVLMRERDEKVASQTQEIDSNSMTPYH